MKVFSNTFSGSHVVKTLTLSTLKSEKNVKKTKKKLYNVYNVLIINAYLHFIYLLL